VTDKELFAAMAALAARLEERAESLAVAGTELEPLDAYHLGRVVETFNAAEQGLFKAANMARHYGDLDAFESHRWGELKAASAQEAN
jgi:hypothetical protein